MLNLIRRLFDPPFRERERAWETYHATERSCRVLCEDGSTGFVIILRNRLNDLLDEYPMDEAVTRAAETLHEELRDEAGKERRP